MDPLTRYGPDPDGNMHPGLGGEWVLATEAEMLAGQLLVATNILRAWCKHGANAEVLERRDQFLALTQGIVR